ncbi:MAG: peptidase [Alphaproteobacteria bacterium]|nr:peptidase [Alphaproteobacteria bacterium]
MILFSLLFLGIMAAAAIYDLATYTIPNFLPVLLVAAFAAFALWCGLSWPDLGGHLAAGISMLVTGWALFALGLLGGGDAKLLASTSLWMGWGGMINYLIMFSLCGGIVALLLLLFRRLPMPNWMQRQGWVTALHDAANGVPYGIALAIGAVLAWPGLLGAPG